MQTDILWTGHLYHSQENCRLVSTETGWEATSVITGVHEHQNFNVEYFIRTGFGWETILVQLTAEVGDRSESLVLQSDGQGNWMKNQAEAPEFEGCIDVDISLTPFTNSLPINRLRMEKGETRPIKVLYLDILNTTEKPVIQHYTLLSDTDYKFENVPNDFEAVIRVDAEGLVENYPGLFERL